MSEHLLPCPFCGGRLGVANEGHKDDCYIMLLLHSNAGPREITAAWNRRATDGQRAEPVAWVEAEPSARDSDVRTVMRGHAYSTRWHWQAERPATRNPVWPIFADGQQAGVPEGAFIPRTAHEMVEFIGSNYDTMQADAWTQEEIQRPAGDLNNVRYSLTVHDLLSAFQWAGLLDAPTPPAGDAGQEAPEERIESLFRNRMTPYGLLVRALRIVAASSLYEMAQSTGRTPAELSAVEMGRKSATPELASLTAKFFADKGIHGTQAALMVAVEASKGEKG